MFNDYHYLYVEDDILSREIMEVALHNILQVSKITMFENSANFITRIHNLATKPDIILLDINIEPISGFQVLELLRHDPIFKNTTVIAVTANNLSSEIRQMKEAGFDGAISKPLDISNFPHLMKDIIAGEKVWQA